MTYCGIKIWYTFGLKNGSAVFMSFVLNFSESSPEIENLDFNFIKNRPP
jgi:hypothetical protein